MNTAPRPFVGSDEFVPDDESQSIQRDLAVLFPRLGAKALRTTVINLDSLERRSSWWITSRIEIDADTSEHGWNTASPSFPIIVRQLSHKPVGQVFVKQLDPLRSLYVWRIESNVAVFAEARYVDTNRVPADGDAALVHELCTAAYSVGESGPWGAGDASGRLPKRDGSRSWRGHPRWVSMVGKVCAVLMLCCAAVSAWLVTKAVPDARELVVRSHQEALRLRTQVDAGITRSISAALMKGDYGEVQEILSPYAEIGYVAKAAVANARQRTVAVAGAWPQLKIGAPVSEEAVGSAKSLQLTLGSENLGRLFIVAPPPPVSPETVQAELNRVTVGAAVMLGLALICVWILFFFG